eukprot:1145922-Pelagomonas_calceolata.AAC.1
MQPCAPKGQGSLFNMGAAPKLKDLELLSMEVAAAGSMHGGSRANLSRGRVDGPHSHSFRSRGVQRQVRTQRAALWAGVWVGRLSEPMEVSEDNTDEMMEGTSG